MTHIETLQAEAREKFPCIAIGCDGNGSIANKISEDDLEQEQCEYCFRFRFPMIAFIAHTVNETLRKVEEGVPKDMPKIKDEDPLWDAHYSGYRECRTTILSHIKSLQSKNECV